MLELPAPRGESVATNRVMTHLVCESCNGPRRNRHAHPDPKPSSTTAINGGPARFEQAMKSPTCSRSYQGGVQYSAPFAQLLVVFGLHALLASLAPGQ